MTIAQQEIFGPVLAMLPYDSEEEAIQIANDTPYGLAGYVQSGDLDHRVPLLPVSVRVTFTSTARLPAWMSPSAATSNQVMAVSGVHGFTDYLEIKAISGFEAA